MKNINDKMHLAKDLSPDGVERVPTRDGYGKGLVVSGKADERVVVLCADLSESTRSHWFAEQYPERYVQVEVCKPG